MKSAIDLTRGSVSGRLFRMTVPMIGGMFAMSAFNLTDAYFVSRLGKTELAAMSFTFPVVMVVASVAFGLATGTASCVARAIGEGNMQGMKRLCTDSLILTLILTSLLAGLGLLVSRPVFVLMGAEGKVLELVMSYMNIWFLSVAVLFVPMVGNHSIRASGDTLIPGLIMMGAALLNAILDPIFIFGMLGVPAMGIRGAAVATLLARAVSMVASISILHFRYRFLAFSLPPIAELLASWKSILRIALPASATNMLMPVSMGIITRIIAEFGTVAVAAVGAAGRVQMFFYMVPMAMGSTLMPFVGQNWGAGEYARIRQVRRNANWFSMVYSVVCIVVVWLSGHRIGRLFGQDPELVRIFSNYLMIVFIGSGMQHIAVHSGFCLNAMGRPWTASMFDGIRTMALLVPLAIIGSKLWGLNGAFWGLSVANMLAGALSLIILHRILNRVEQLNNPERVAC